VHDTANATDQPTPGRCLVDGDRPRPVATAGSRVCAAHRTRLADLLDPAQTGQVFSKPGERPTPASIGVLYGGLDPQPVRRAMDSQALAGAFGSTPPGRLDVMSLRDRRSVAAADADLWSVLGTLVGIAMRLDVRDIHGTLTPIPDTVQAVCAWLHVRLDHLCAADWIADAWHDLRTVHYQLRNAAGDPVMRPLGPCWKLVDDNGKLSELGKFKCGAPLYLPPQPLKGMDEPVVLPSDLRCASCGGHYDRAEIVRVGRDRARRVADERERRHLQRSA
jgi:hypothetical protein